MCIVPVKMNNNNKQKHKDEYFKTLSESMKTLE